MLIRRVDSASLYSYRYRFIYEDYVNSSHLRIVQDDDWTIRIRAEVRGWTKRSGRRIKWDNIILLNGHDEWKRVGK